MKKLFFILLSIVMFLATICGALGVLSDDVSVAYRFINSTDFKDWSNNLGTATNSGSSYGASGIVDGARDFTSSVSQHVLTPSFGGSNMTTINYWYKFDVADVTSFTLGINSGSDNFVYFNSANIINAWPVSACLADNSTVIQHTTGVWGMVTVSFNGARGRIYYNGTFVKECTTTDQWVTRQWPIGSSKINTGIEGLIDEWTAWNRELTPSEVTTLYECYNNDGEGYPFTSCGSGVSSPSVTLVSPSDNDHANSQTFSFTVDQGVNNCSLIFNNTINMTQSNNNNFTITSLDGEKIVEWNINCTNSTTGTGSGTSRSFYFDNVNPIWSINTVSGNSSSFEKNTTDYFLQYNDSVTDIYLFEVNWTLRNTTSVLENFYISNMNTTTYSNTDDYTLTHYGIYYIDVVATDDHTKKVIPQDWFYSKSTDTLSFDTKTSFITIRFDDKDTSLKTLDVDYNIDRYNFIFSNNFKQKQDEYEYEFYFESNNTIYDRTNLWGGIPTFVTGHNWVDFKLKNDENTTYETLKISNNIYKIKLITENELLEFESLGGLNIVKEYYSFVFQNITNSSSITTTITDGYSSDKKTTFYDWGLDISNPLIKKLFFYEIKTPNLKIKPNNFTRYLFSYSDEGVFIAIYSWMLIVVCLAIFKFIKF